MDFGWRFFVLMIFGAFLGLTTPILGGAFVVYIHLLKGREPNWSAVLAVLGVTLAALLGGSALCLHAISPWAN